MNILDRQRKSREKLDAAAARYTNLRAGDGRYVAPPIHTFDRQGRPVTVLLELTVFSRSDVPIKCAGCPSLQDTCPDSCYRPKPC